MSSVRAFIAVEIPDDIKRGIAEVQKDLPVEGIRKVEAEKIHITLKFLGNVEGGRLKDIRDWLSATPFQKFSVEVNGIGAFPNERYPRVIWLGCENEKLSMLARDIEKSLAGLFGKEEFKGHITIARVKSQVSLGGFLKKYRTCNFGRFEVSSFSLKKSELHATGPKYTTIGKFSCSE